LALAYDFPVSLDKVRPLTFASNASIVNGLFRYG
jgi:hypothetical protein